MAKHVSPALAPELAMQMILCVGPMARVTGNSPNMFAGLLKAVKLAGVNGVNGHRNDGVGAPIEATLVLPSTLRADC